MFCFTATCSCTKLSETIHQHFKVNTRAGKVYTSASRVSCLIGTWLKEDRRYISLCFVSFQTRVIPSFSRTIRGQGERPEGSQRALDFICVHSQQLWYKWILFIWYLSGTSCLSGLPPVPDLYDILHCGSLSFHSDCACVGVDQVPVGRWGWVMPQQKQQQWASEEE